MPTSIDVVIPVHNRFALTDSCLRHLRAQTLRHRVIVVDNGSTDGTPELLHRDWPEAHVERFEHSLGFAEACNHGVSAGTGEVVVLLNNDVDCRPDFLERLVAPFDRDRSVGAAAALMLRPGERAIDSLGLCADVTLAAFPRLSGLPAEKATERGPVLAGPAGAAAAYRRGAWSEVGGLDERIRAYMEDFELALRLRAAGWRTVAAADAVGVHVGSATHERGSASQRRLLGFGRGYVVRRYGVLGTRHALRAVATELIVVIGDALLSRDLAAVKGRAAGWRAARQLPSRPWPAADVIDDAIGFRASLSRRLGIYGH